MAFAVSRVRSVRLQFGMISRAIRVALVRVEVELHRQVQPRVEVTLVAEGTACSASVRFAYPSWP